MNRPTSRLSVVLAMVALATASLPGCSSSGSPSSPSTSSSSSSNAAAQSSPADSATASPADGTASCTKAALADAATGAAQAMGKDNVYTIHDVQCADGWAVTSGLLASQANPKMGAPTTFVFQQQGQQWVAQDKAKVCGTNPTTTPAPADAKIPAALYMPGCLT